MASLCDAIKQAVRHPDRRRSIVNGVNFLLRSVKAPEEVRQHRSEWPSTVLGFAVMPAGGTGVE